MGEQLLQFLISGLTNGAVYALIALGFIIIYNATEIINFAQGEFVMLGGMVMVTLQRHCHLPFFLAFFLTLMLVSIIGVSFAFLAIRPALHRASLVSLIIITIGGSILFRGIAMFIWGKHPYPALPFSGDKPISILGACILPQSLWIIGCPGSAGIGQISLRN
jgi:branched-chain amino acid transport system permease protein